MAAIEPHWKSTDRTVVNRFVARSERIASNAPGAIGYFIGYRIIEAYVQRRGADSWREVDEIPATAVLERSGYGW